MFRNQSVDVHKFAMVPRADIPRSSFRIQSTHKTTFDAGYLIPVYVDEVLPGDSFNVRMTAFARLSTPLFPIMDNLYLDSFFFFVPCRLVWSNWKKFMGEQDSPGDSTDFIVPSVNSPDGGFAPLSVFDYMGCPTVGQVAAGNIVAMNAMPFRAYSLIWNEWFRDENLQNPSPVPKTDGPDVWTDYSLLKRGKRHDYFTSALPWPQKGPSVPFMVGTVPVKSATGHTGVQLSNSGPDTQWFPAGGTASASGLYADLAASTAQTINQLRQAFQIQKLLERDARGGTRYTEIVRAHFGVVSPDARLQRPEYLGGGSTPISISPIAQTSATLTSVDETRSTTPLGNLGAMGTAVSSHGFSASFTEHGYVLGLVSVRADLTYQQGIRKLWNRWTRYDFYFPAFAMLGEQAIYQREIFCDGSPADVNVFGYQERWAEYRYHPARVSGLFRSTTAGTIDAWHLAQRFNTRPVLDATFIAEAPPLDRILAVGPEANGQQIIFDSFFDARAARPMPLYSVPGLIDHF